MIRCSSVLSRTFLPLALLLLPAATRPAHAAGFLKPTPEELAMKELPGYPGASAVVLLREEEDLDDLHVVKRYERIKILTEKGKDLANVEIRYASTASSSFYEVGDEKDVTDIAGRTIHPDGTIVPFTGKPYLKTLEKGKGIKVQARVFTLPDVNVGDIIEYRYATRIADHVFEAPNWYIQGDLYVKEAKFTWHPTAAELVGHNGARINTISWFPVLPPGVNVEKTEMARPTGMSRLPLPLRVFSVSLHDVPPAPHEEFMPPIDSFTYRVLFNFSEYHTMDEYWRSEGKQWSKNVDSFLDVNSELREIAAKITTGESTTDGKLRKLYAAVQALENTDFTREHNQAEDKAAGLHKLNRVSEVYSRGRGNSRQLTDLFLGLARASGLEAYAMLVPDRGHTLFVPQWMNMSQFDDVIAIVHADGKDLFLDPGQRFCPFGHLAWQHTFVQGLRQTADGTALQTTLGDGYQSNRTSRVANLVMEDNGEVSGRVDLTFLGSPALFWRHRALQGDEESIRHSLKKDLEAMLPQSLEVTVNEIQNLTDYEKPLTVHFHVKGPIGTPTGKRLVIPADLFTANNVAHFPHDKRELAVYFEYPEAVQDALRIVLPKTMKVEAVPDALKAPLDKAAVYDLRVVADPNSVTSRRNFIFGDFVVVPQDYGKLRSFYSQFQAKDHDSIVLSTAPATATSAPAAAKSGGF